MSWTDERVELLRRMWGEGRTAAEIAGELGGTTRNAVIGKAHRLKLSGRASPIAVAAPPAVETAKKIVLPVPANRDRPPVVAAPPRAQGPVAVAAGKARPAGVKMADLRDRMCRWPFGDPKAADFHFCGCPSVAGMPYCADHSRAAYQVARARTLSPQDFDKPGHGDDEAKEAAG